MSIVLLLAACGRSPGPAAGSDAISITWSYPSIPADPQRAGDPAKGYDYLINGGYITCGLPKSLYDSVFGAAPAAERIPGRTGDNATLPYYYSAAMSTEGIEVVSANCLTCHASSINGTIVVGLGAAAGDFTGNQAAQIDAVGGLISDPTAHAEWQRFDTHMDAIAPYVPWQRAHVSSNTVCPFAASAASIGNGHAGGVSDSIQARTSTNAASIA